MNKSVKTLAAIALGSLIVGATVPSAFAGDHADSTSSATHKDSCKGHNGCNGGDEHHKDKNSCKGTASKDKNSCKGHEQDHGSSSSHAHE